MPEDIIKRVHYSKLHLDHDHNPRLPSKLVGTTDTDIINYMLEKGNAIELMGSIGEKGYFDGEPLLVIEADDPDEYTVVEGNRRLSAVKLLHDPALAKIKKESVKQLVSDASNKPEDLPVIVYSNRSDILNYLGYRHITGIKEWDSLAKAKYLHQLYEKSVEENHRAKCLELARTIGSRVDYVGKLLCALKVYNNIEDEAYFGIENLEDKISFSLITTALGYTNLYSFLGLESNKEIDIEDKLKGQHLKELTLWMFKKVEGVSRLGESRNLDQLSSVVANDSALAAFRGGMTLETSFFLSEGPKEMVVNAIWNAYEKLDLAYNYSRDVTLESAQLKQLEEIIKTATAIQKLTAPDHK